MKKIIKNLIISLSLFIATINMSSTLFLFATSQSANVIDPSKPNQYIHYDMYALYYFLPMLIFSIIVALACKELASYQNLIITTIISYAAVAESIWEIVPDVYIFGSALILGLISIPIAAKIKLPAFKKAEEEAIYVSVETQNVN